MQTSNREVMTTRRLRLRSLGALVAVMLALTVTGGRAGAQQPDVDTGDLWFGVTGDLRIAPRALVTFTSEDRRTDGVRLARQFFSHVGLLADVGRGIRVGAGIAGWHTSPNASLGVARAMGERRVWQQLTGSHRSFGAAWNHRTRFEQRWIAPVVPDGDTRDWSYSTRLRHQLRVVVPLDGRSPAASRLYAMPNAEGFVRTTKHKGTLVDQLRLGAALGFAVAPRMNLEAGYMRQSFVHGGEWFQVHHVLQVTARVLAQAR